MAQTIEGVRQALGQEKTALAFSQGFAKAYLGQAFGTLPKSEIDLLVFQLLMDTRVLDPTQPIYEIARSLNVTPAKARNLLFQYQLRTMTETQVDSSVLIAVTTAKWGLDAQRIGFGVESPLVRAAIQAKAKGKNVFPDVSLSGEILYVPMNQVGDFIAAFLPGTEARKLIERLRKRGVADPDNVTKALNKIGEAIVTEAAKAGGKAGAKELGDVLFGWINDLLEGADADVPEVLGAILDAA